jgi:hypothetical protein
MSCDDRPVRENTATVSTASQVSCKNIASTCAVQSRALVPSVQRGVCQQRVAPSSWRACRRESKQTNESAVALDLKAYQGAYWHTF